MKREFSPQEQAVNQGVELAYKANDAFDAFQVAQQGLGILIQAKRLGAEVSPELGVRTQEALIDNQKLFIAHVEAAGQYIGDDQRGNKALGADALAPPTTSVNPEKPKLSIVESPVRADFEVWDSLSSEQKEKASKLITGMAEKFEVDKEDFSIVVTETESEAGATRQQYTIAYAGGNGLYRGAWNQIMDTEAAGDFVIEIDGREVDTREGMTLSVYKAMVNQAQANSEILPDSQELAERNGEPWTWTLRTGEKVGAKSAPYVTVYGEGQVYDVWRACDDSEQNVRFRPAVILE